MVDFFVDHTHHLLMSLLYSTIVLYDISKVFEKKYPASILVKIIETVFSILSPECREFKD